MDDYIECLGVREEKCESNKDNPVRHHQFVDIQVEKNGNSQFVKSETERTTRRSNNERKFIIGDVKSKFLKFQCHDLNYLNGL